jgi:Uma2 family endonuclease
MADPAKRRATYEDVLAAPKRLVAEVINGVLHTNPRPASPHARATTRLTTKLGGPFDLGDGGPGGWILLDEPELHLGDDIIDPDIAGWRRERMPVMPHAPYFELAPDWVCEMLSPSTEAIDRTEKMPIYLREGVKHVWLGNALTQTLEVYRHAGREWTLVSTWRGDAKVRAEPFDAIELDLGALWAR